MTGVDTSSTRFVSVAFMGERTIIIWTEDVVEDIGGEGDNLRRTKVQSGLGNLRRWELLFS